MDKTTRTVTLERIEIAKSRFPGAADEGREALGIVREVLSSGARTVSLDYLITALGFEQAAARQGSAGLKHTPPEIIWVTNRAVLVRIDGEPISAPYGAANLERVLNTPELLVHDKTAGKFYLSGDANWFEATSLNGPWAIVHRPPKEVHALAPLPTNAPAVPREDSLPQILVRTNPAELLYTSGLPDYRPIRGTALRYAADSDSQLFYHTQEDTAYVLFSGGGLLPNR